MNRTRVKMYAIVDIETTGGHAKANGITEIAIVVFDGVEVVQRYRSLVNPEVSIPIYIQALTGIDGELVKDAPVFKDIAEDVFELLQNKVLVAHNVNFDYSFIKHHLSQAGFEITCKRLCTVRLSRKIFAGLPSYSLGKLCKQLNIPIENRHRAFGDADATAILFSMLLSKDRPAVEKALNQRSREQCLPPHVPKEQFTFLPSCAGVYYFKDEKGKVIYVGKAKNLHKRIHSHFSGNNTGRKRQEFLRTIHAVNYETCGTELLAYILETVEIKRLWPKYNVAQKVNEQSFGLYCFEDQRGYLRLAIDKKAKLNFPIYSFKYLADGYSLLRKIAKAFNLCPKLCFIQQNNNDCMAAEEYCNGACCGKEETSIYNNRVTEALAFLKGNSSTYLILDEGRTIAEKSCILVENGKFYGMGYLESRQHISSIDEARALVVPYQSNEYIENLIYNYSVRYPEKQVRI